MTQKRRTARYVLYAALLAGGFCVLWLFISSYTLSASKEAQTIQTDSLFQTDVQTTDHIFLLEFKITPKSVGTNTFVTRVMEVGTGRVRTDVGIDLYAVNTDMDMGMKVIHLQPDGKDAFTANDVLSMEGHWNIHIKMRTHQNMSYQADVSFKVVT